MTDQEIDKLEGAELDLAIASVCEDIPASALGYKGRWWKYDHDLWLRTSKVEFIPARSFCNDGGNVAVELLAKLREWDYLWDVGVRGNEIEAVAGNMDTEEWEFVYQGTSFETTVARLFLRVVEARKAVPS